MRKKGAPWHGLFDEFLNVVLGSLGISFQKKAEPLLRELKAVPDLAVEVREMGVVSPASWVYWSFSSRRLTVVEFKGPNVRPGAEDLLQIIEYRVKLIRSGYSPNLIIVLIVPDFAGLEEVARKYLNAGVREVAPGVFIVAGNAAALRTVVVCVNRLDDSVRENRFLMLFSSQREKRVRSAKELLTLLPPDSRFRTYIRVVLLALGDSEFLQMVLPPEDFKAFVEKYGLDKLIEAVGIDRLIEAVGLDKLIEAVGIDRLIEALEELAKRDPKVREKLKRIAE